MFSWEDHLLLSVPIKLPNVNACEPGCYADKDPASDVGVEFHVLFSLEAVNVGINQRLTCQKSSPSFSRQNDRFRS